MGNSEGVQQYSCDLASFEEKYLHVDPDECIYLFRGNSPIINPASHPFYLAVG